MKRRKIKKLTQVVKQLQSEVKLKDEYLKFLLDYYQKSQNDKINNLYELVQDYVKGNLFGEAALKTLKKQNEQIFN